MNIKQKKTVKVLKTYMDKQMQFYSHDPSADKIRFIQSEVDQIKGIMYENIEKALHRGEQLEQIEDKTSILMEKSVVWNKSSKELRSEILKRNYMCYILLGIGILIVFAVGCGLLVTFT